MDVRDYETMFDLISDSILNTRQTYRLVIPVEHVHDHCFKNPYYMSAHDQYRAPE